MALSNRQLASTTEVHHAIQLVMDNTFWNEGRRTYDIIIRQIASADKLEAPPHRDLTQGREVNRPLWWTWDLDELAAPAWWREPLESLVRLFLASKVIELIGCPRVP